MAFVAVMNPHEHVQETSCRELACGRLEHAMDKYPRQLSGGMRQRVSLIRTLVHEPAVILMDEPFGALDALTRLEVRTDLESLWLRRRPTVLFITHSVEEAVGLSDRILVRPESAGCALTDYRDARRTGDVRRGESTAANDRNAKRGKVLRCDVVTEDRWRLPRSRGRPSLDVKNTARRACHRRTAVDRNGAHAGYALERGDQLGHERWCSRRRPA